MEENDERGMMNDEREMKTICNEFGASKMPLSFLIFSIQHSAFSVPEVE
jgi:hypothetical protein